jgi:hypothetical protein
MEPKNHQKCPVEEEDFKQALLKSGFVKKHFNVRSGALGAIGTIFKSKQGCIVRIAAAVSGRNNIRRIVNVSIDGEGRVLEEERTPEGISKALTFLKDRGYIKITPQPKPPKKHE